MPVDLWDMSDKNVHHKLSGTCLTKFVGPAYYEADEWCFINLLDMSDKAYATQKVSDEADRWQFDYSQKAG